MSIRSCLLDTWRIR